MSEAKGLYRTTAKNGMEVAFIDKGLGNALGIPRERYESSGYTPPFDQLPEK